MRGKCLDEGTLQSYMDGELEAAQSAEASAHVSECAACAEALAAAQAEFAFFSAAFGAEEPSPVPTERIRARIDAALAARDVRQTEPRRGGGWSLSAVAAWLAAPFSAQPRFAGAFASVVALVALTAVFGLVFMRDGGTGPETAKKTEAPAVAAPAAAPEVARKPEETTVAATKNQPDVREVEASAVKGTKPERAPVIVAAGGTRTTNRPAKVNAGSRPNDENEAVQPVVADLAKQAVPGEENYLRTIASLSKVIEMSGDGVLRPAVRVEYERNLAVIDRAIEDTRKSAVRNPKDPDATQFLFSAYRTKIDLLSTVADQAQVATLGR
jgi:anti-sigma factor RsiW